MDIESMTDAWVSELASSPLIGTRRQLARVVAECIEPQKHDWLELLADDFDAHVARVVAEQLLAERAEGAAPFDMASFEERFVEGVAPNEFAWEWEYGICVWVPGRGPYDRLVRLKHRDDEEARTRALATLWKEGASPPTKGGAFIKTRRLVCEYTRSARSSDSMRRGRSEDRPSSDD